VPGTDANRESKNAPRRSSADPDIGFVVVWDEYYQNDQSYIGLNTRVAARRLDAGGAIAGSQLVVAVSPVSEIRRWRVRYGTRWRVSRPPAPASFVGRLGIRG
jgi:hypothetical protein